MGFFSSLFGHDFSSDLDRVEADLANDEPVLALERARKVAKGAPDGSVRARAEALVDLARVALVARARARAEASERAGELADAIDWIGSALANDDTDKGRSELEAWRARLLEELDRGATPFATRVVSETGAEPSEPGDGELEGDPLWEAWLATFTEELAPRWEGRSARFEAAVVAINDGRAEAAVEALDAELDGASDDVVARFERGRALLALGRFDDAAQDLEVAWAELGSRPLDAAGSVSIPAMWAEAKLGSGALDEVATRLEPLRDARSEGGLEPALLYAHAVAGLGRVDEADALLTTLGRLAPRDPRFPLDRAAVLSGAGRRGEAIALLEAAVAPTCRPGCATPPHLPSMRALAALHLEAGDDVERARELVVFVAHRNGGALAAVDHGLLARYYDAVGNTVAAQEAREQAQALLGVDVDRVSPLLVAGGRRVL